MTDRFRNGVGRLVLAVGFDEARDFMLKHGWLLQYQIEGARYRLLRVATAAAGPPWGPA